MSDRYTRKDAEALCETLRWFMQQNDELEALADRLFLNHESGVYRLRYKARPPESWESDISPGMTTAREAWLYLRGVQDGLGMPATAEHYAELDAR